ncbi:hypothetical protein YC2023_076012 [Brassica napus]
MYCWIHLKVKGLDSLIMEAMSTRKEHGCSNKTSIGTYIEEQYQAPPDFKHLVQNLSRYHLHIFFVKSTWREKLNVLRENYIYSHRRSNIHDFARRSGWSRRGASVRLFPWT